LGVAGKAGKTFHKILTDARASQSDRLIAAKLAGDFTVINDTLVSALLAIIRSANEPDELRATAAISLGPVLEHGDTDGFDDPDDSPITRRTFRDIKDSLHTLFLDQSVPKEVRHRILEGVGTRSPKVAPGRDRNCLFQRRYRVDAERCVFNVLGSRFR
jgi:hypothetical protein